MSEPKPNWQSQWTCPDIFAPNKGMIQEPPRLKHNRALSAAYISSAGSPPRYPKVSEQVECLPMDTGKLFKHAYNPTIIDRGGSIYMAYRYHEGTLATKLALASVSATGAIEGNVNIESDCHSLEDPKFFTHNDQAYLCFVHSNFPSNINAVVKYARLDGDHLNEIVQPFIGKNDFTATEKNWVFWSMEGELFCLYRCQQTQKIFQVEDGKGVALNETPMPHWPYGEPRGGTPPVEYDGKLLRFFHTHLQNEITPPHHRYYVGACLMEPTPPFAVTQISRKPVIYGSESDDLTPEQRKECKHWKPNVVFPGGCVVRDGYWLLALGENDSACRIVKIAPENLNL